MRQNYSGDRRRKEEARKKKQEEKRNKRLGKLDAPETPEVKPPAFGSTLFMNRPNPPAS